MVLPSEAITWQRFALFGIITDPDRKLLVGRRHVELDHLFSADPTPRSAVIVAIASLYRIGRWSVGALVTRNRFDELLSRSNYGFCD